VEKISRKAAKAAGLTRYFTGKPCPQGHIVQRHVSGFGCVECTRVLKRAWEKANPEGQAKRSRAWFLANKEKAAASSKAWAERNQERDKATRKAWKKANPDRVAAIKASFIRNNPGVLASYTAKRRAVEMQRTPAWADLDCIDSLYALAAIYRDFGHQVEVDHGVPLQGKRVSGLHVHENLTIIPMRENRAKSNHFPL
jgi:hypothetical protein